MKTLCVVDWKLKEKLIVEIQEHKNALISSTFSIERQFSFAEFIKLLCDVREKKCLADRSDVDLRHIRCKRLHQVVTAHIKADTSP